MKTFMLSLLLILSVSLLLAQKADQMIGVTAAQYARGGAIIASPVDAPSMIYNPAAIGVLEFEKIRFDNSLGIINPPRSITTGVGTPMEKKTESGSNAYLAMGNGFIYKVSDKLILGLAAGGVSGLGVNFPSTTFPDNPVTPFPENVSLFARKGLLKLTPTIAYKIIDNLTIGVSLQIVNQTLSLKSPAFMLPASDSWGLGGCIGLIYKATSNLQFGFAYTSETKIPEHEFNGTSLIPQTGGEGIYTLEMNSPQHIGFGVAYKAMQKLLIETDIKWVDLSATMLSNNLISPSGYSIPCNFGWEDIMIYSVGTEYCINKGLKIIGGWSYAETPITEDIVDNNVGSIAVVEHHFSLGINKSITENLSSTFNYTRGLYNEVKSSTSPLMIEAEFNMFFMQISYKL